MLLAGARTMTKPGNNCLAPRLSPEFNLAIALVSNFPPKHSRSVLHPVALPKKHRCPQLFANASIPAAGLIDRRKSLCSQCRGEQATTSSIKSIQVKKSAAAAAASAGVDNETQQHMKRCVSGDEEWRRRRRFFLDFVASALIID